jgi:hypothetical protein
MLTEYESMTGSGVRGVKLASAAPPALKTTDEDREPVALEAPDDAPKLLQF